MAEKRDKDKAKDKSKKTDKAKAQPKAKAKAQPESKAAAAPAAKTDSKAAAKPEPKAKAKPEVKPATKAAEVSKEVKVKAAEARKTTAEEKSQARVAALAAERAQAAEKAKAEAGARRAELEKRKAEAAAAAADRASKSKESRETRLAERQKAREAVAAAAIERAIATKAQRDALLAEREKTRAEAREAARARAEAQRSAREGKRTPASPEAKGPKAPAAKAAAKTPPARSAKKEPVQLGIGLLLPGAVQRELGKALKSASKSAGEQALGYLKLPDGVEARERAKLDLLRKKIAKALEDAIQAIGSKLLSEASAGSGLSLNANTGRAVLEFPPLSLSDGLRRALSAPMRELSQQLAGDEGALKKFSALGSPLMLQYFGDLDTGQQLDGSLILTVNAENTSKSSIQHVMTLASGGKKSKAPSVKLEFGHDLGLSEGKGSLQASFAIALPEEPAKS